MTITTPPLPGRRGHHIDTDSDLSRLGRLRWTVRAVLILGVAASIAANVLHARPNLISQVIAAWPPLALLLTVELISRVPADRRGLAATRLLSAAVITGIAGWVSYWHMVGVAARYGETSAHANYLLPLSVDGLVVVASISLVEIAGRINRPHRAATSNPIPNAVPAAAATTIRVSQLPPAGITAAPVTVSAGKNAPPPPDAVTGFANGAAPADPIPPAPPEYPFGSSHQPSAPGSRDDHHLLDAVEGNRTATQRDNPAAAGPMPAVDAATASAQLLRDGDASATAVPRTDGGTAADHDGRPPLPQAASGDGPPAAAMDAREKRGDQYANDGAVPSETAAAVAYWYRRDPQLHPAAIGAKIGRSERTVRRHWPPEPEPVGRERE